MEIIEKHIAELKEYANNPRNNDGAVDAVAQSIIEFGFKVPIIIDSGGVIVAGHTRKKAAEQLGIDKVPCIVADDLTPEQIKAFRLADNKTGELAEWDFTKLETELSELESMDINFLMTDFGFEFHEDTAPKEKERNDLSDDVAECFEIIVECKDETEQEQIYNRLTKEGLICRVLTL